MSKKRHTPEQIINKLRQAEAELVTGATVAEVLVERWRRHHSTVRPQSSVRYRSAAPRAIQPWASGCAPLSPPPRAAWQAVKYHTRTGTTIRGQASGNACGLRLPQPHVQVPGARIVKHHGEWLTA